LAKFDVQLKRTCIELEDEIEQLDGLKEPSSVEKARLKQLKSELERINKKKEDYVEEHPEQRKLVYRARRQQHDEEKERSGGERTRNLFKKNGLPRKPERSIYYHPVMNPFGLPPPGHPYMERRASLSLAFDASLNPIYQRRFRVRNLATKRITKVCTGSVGTYDISPKLFADSEDDDVVMPEGPPPGPSAQTQDDSDSDDSIPMPDGPPPCV
jgi:hypothetical protein